MKVFLEQLEQAAARWEELASIAAKEGRIRDAIKYAWNAQIDRRMISKFA